MIQNKENQKKTLKFKIIHLPSLITYVVGPDALVIALADVNGLCVTSVPGFECAKMKKKRLKHIKPNFKQK